MGSFREEPVQFDLEKELERAEGSAAASVARESVGRIEPDVHYANALEARLRVAATSLPHGSAAALSSVQSVEGRSIRRLSTRPVARMSLIGAGLAGAVVAVLWLSILFRPTWNAVSGIAVEIGTSSPSVPTVQSAGGDFVPRGKVRHIVTTHTSHVVGAPDSTTPDWTDEIWIANGKEHYMMRRISTMTGTMIGGMTGMAADLLVGDTSTWVYYPKPYWGDSTGKVVYKIPYSPGLVAQYIPDKEFLERVLAQPNTRVVGEDTLDGVPVRIVESTGNADPHVWVDIPSSNQWSPMEVLIFARYDALPTGSIVMDRAPAPGRVTSTVQVTPIVKVEPGISRFSTIDYRLWVGGDDRVLQEEYTRNPGPRNQFTPLVSRVKITRDELLDASAVPDGLFTFSLPDPAARLVDAIGIATELGPASATSGTGQPSSWQVYTAPGGDFSLLLPDASPDVVLKDGWRTFSAEQGDVTYAISYRDYDTMPEAGQVDNWLDQQALEVVAGMEGTPKFQTPVNLDDYSGRELSIQRADGRFARSRIYLVGKRLYNIYAVAADEKAAYSEELGLSRFLGSFKLLKR